MSTNVEHYVIVGIDAGARDKEGSTYDKFEKLGFEPDEGNYGCVFDGMNEQYAICGYCLFKGDEYDGIESGATGLDGLNNCIRKNVEIWLNGHGIEFKEVRLHVVSHWH